MTNSLGAAESRVFGVTSSTDLTCHLLCLMAWDHYVVLIQLCMFAIPFPPWHSSKKAFAT